MKKIYFLFILLALAIFPLVSATEDSSLGTFKQGSTINLMQTCDSCTYVTLVNVVFPDGTFNNIDENMTKSGQTYNYSFSDTEQIGFHSYSVCGDKDNTLKCETITFEVTPNGSINNLGFYIIVIVLTLGLIIFGYSVEDYNLIILGSFGLILFGLYILFYGIAGMKDVVYTWGIGIIILMVGAYFGVRAGIEQLQ